MTWPQAKDAWGHQEPGEARKDPVLSFWREPGSANTWTVALWPPDGERIHFRCFRHQAVLRCYSSHRKWVHLPKVPGLEWKDPDLSQVKP